MPANSAEIVIGVVTADSSRQVESLRAEVAAGMREYFPQYTWTLVHASSSGPLLEGGPQRTLSIPVPLFGVHHITYPWHCVPAKTNGYRAILECAREKRAHFCLLVDAEQSGFESRWIDALLRPGVHSKYDLVTPVYSNSSCGRLLSANLLSPLLRALFGQGPRQPMPGELLISARLMDRLLARHDWDSMPARYAPELWISFIAAAEKFRIAESGVGPSRLRPRRLRLPGQIAFEQIVGSMFVLMDQYEDSWSSPPSAAELDRFGQPSFGGCETVEQDGLSHLVRFVEAYDALQGQWQSILDPHTFAELRGFQEMVRRGETERVLADAVWVRIVYEMSAAWKRRDLPRSHVLGLFMPLFWARVGSFLMTTQYEEQAEAAAVLNRLRGMFVALQPVLVRLWRSGTAEAA